MSPDEVDLLIPHQANSRIIAMVAAKLGMPMSKVILTLNGHGNTSAASIPLAMDVAISEGKLKRGMKVMLCAAGAGFTWGSVLLQY
jgi:3-oxoacyl-[acyl-carrier-protein] synthase-3